MEPPTNRSRLAQLIAEGAQDEDGDELNFQPHEVSEMRDPDVQLAKKREAVGNRFQAAMSSIFDKYGRDFEDIGDEIDFETGEIVVDNGHLANMRYDGDIGSLDGEEEEEDEGILLEDWEGESHASNGSVRDDEEPALPSGPPPAPKDAPSASTDLQELAPTGGYPWNFGLPRHSGDQPGAAFPSPGQHPAMLPFTNLYPPFMSAPFGSLPTSISGPGAGAASLPLSQPKKRVQKSLFTSRFSSKGKKKDHTEEAKDEPANSDSQNAQPAQESKYMTDDEDELLSEQYTIAPQTKEGAETRVVEEPATTSIASPPAGSNSTRDETTGTQDRVATRPGEDVVLDDESQTLEATKTLEGLVDHEMSGSEAVLNHDMPGPDLVCAETGGKDASQGGNTINEHRRSNGIDVDHTRIKSEDGTTDLSLLQTTTACVHTPSAPLSPPRSTGNRDFSADNELPLPLKSESPPKQPIASQDAKLPRNPEMMYISPTKHIEQTGTKHSPAKPPTDRGSATPHRVSKMPLTPRHARTATIRTPSTRRSILSLLSDEEEDEMLLSEKHAVSIPNLFSSSRRKRGRSDRHSRRSGIYDTPTKKRPRKDPPPKATNLTQAHFGCWLMDLYREQGACHNAVKDLY
ncbi:hypothetical protein V2G26_011686 [Clonostachys chloroleuca]